MDDPTQIDEKEDNSQVFQDAIRQLMELLDGKPISKIHIDRYQDTFSENNWQVWAVLWDGKPFEYAVYITNGQAIADGFE